MGLMDGMMDRKMKKMTFEEKKDTMHEMMPRMMENCLSSMTQEERTKMFSFCHNMLGDMEQRFSAAP